MNGPERNDVTCPSPEVSDTQSPTGAPVPLAADGNEIVRALQVILAPGQVTELRALNACIGDRDKLVTLRGFFDYEHIADMAREAGRIKAKGVYFIPNPVSPDLLPYAPNKVEVATRGSSTTDAQIQKYFYVLIDCDAIRPKDTSATDAEHEAAIARAKLIASYLSTLGWPAPILADSGNGCHLLYRIDLPTSDKALVRKCLKSLARRFDDDIVKVDTSVFNPSRIWKLYGTVAAKGPSTLERPHRLSKIIYAPDKPELVSRELLEKLAGDEDPTGGDGPRKKPPRCGAVASIPKTGVPAIDRCLRYLAKCPNAISGNHGHDATFHAACVCFQFGLSDDEARRAMEQFNDTKTGGEKWTAQEIQHKLEDAKKKVEADGTFGKFLTQKSQNYILVPGAHKDDQDIFTEQSSVAFAGTVVAHLPEDAIYRRDFAPGEIMGQAGNRKWAVLSADRMRILVDSNVKLGKWITGRRTGEQSLLYQPCNKDNAGLIMAHAQSTTNIRDLRLMVTYPVFGPGFQLLEPGWRDGLYYDQPEELRGLRPETNSEVIRGVLEDLVVDFPLKTEADRQNFFGLVLTPIVAPAIDGSRPMHHLNSSLERTGKTKLVNEVFGGLIIGRDTPAMQLTESEEEREKRILAMLLQDETLMHLDNLPHYIDSPALASLLTTKFFTGRVLGLSRNVTLPNNLTIIGTGNNVQASGEITKRIVPILMEPKNAHPEARKDFKHPDIRAYVRQQRRVGLECLLGMVENWIAAGKPKHENRLGGFDTWSETVGGILQVNGFTQWRTNEDEWRSRADSRGDEMLRFVQVWHERFVAGEVAPRDLLDLAGKNELFGAILAKQTPQAVAVAFGRMLQRHTDTPVGAWHIRYRNNSGHPCYWLEEIK